MDFGVSTLRELLNDNRNIQLPTDFFQIFFLGLKRKARNIAWRGITVGPIASGYIILDFARAPRSAKRNPRFYYVVELAIREAVIAHPTLTVEFHMVDVHTSIVDEITCELHAAPLVPRSCR